MADTKGELTLIAAYTKAVRVVDSLPADEEIIQLSIGKFDKGGYWWDVSTRKEYGNTASAQNHRKSDNGTRLLEQAYEKALQDELSRG